MTIHISHKGRLRADICLPASKSISNRALIISALTPEGRPPRNISDCDDTAAMLRALASEGPAVDIGAAGTAMRFLTAYYAAQEGATRTITGSERMLHRPVHPLVGALRSLGADISYAGQEGFPPLTIRGRKLRGGDLEIEASVSSQYISALLMIGPTLERGLRLRLTGEIFSRPYIDLTLSMMSEMGASAEWTSNDTIAVHPVSYHPTDFLVESDWSAASYWYSMLALSADPEAELRLSGLFDGSRQGDSIVRYLMSMLGVRTTFLPGGGVRLTPNGRSIHRLDYDFSGAPDLAQTFVVCCAEKNIPFRFTGLQTLRIKETDRIAALQTEMRRLGYTLRNEGDDTLLWDGTRCPAEPHPEIHTYDDHRMALAFAPVAVSRGEITILHPEVVSKSYPTFWEEMKKLWS